MNELQMKTLFAIACGVVLLGGRAAWGVTHEWTRQLGTPSTEYSTGVSADGLGSVYISGMTAPDLGTVTDAFVAKYDEVGNLVWLRELGTDNFQDSHAVSADGLGNVFISGWTQDRLDGPSPPGTDFEAFVAKYDASGSLQWTRQIGAASTPKTAFNWSVSADGLGNAYFAGFAYGSLGGPSAGERDAFVGKYDPAGNLVWLRQFGTSANDIAYAISADNLGNVFLSGSTEGNLGGGNAGSEDAFVRKYDAAGNLVWTKQLGSPGTDWSTGISADGLGNVYISGHTSGSLGEPIEGRWNTFVSMYDSAGSLLWTRQFESRPADRGHNGSRVSADGLGNVYVSSSLSSSLGSYSYVTAYDETGSHLWTEQIGPDAFARGVSADRLGSVYLSGQAQGSVGGPYGGRVDAFLTKLQINQVPEPSTLFLAALPTFFVAICFGRGKVRRPMH